MHPLTHLLTHPTSVAVVWSGRVGLSTKSGSDGGLEHTTIDCPNLVMGERAANYLSTLFTTSAEGGCTSWQRYRNVHHNKPKRNLHSTLLVALCPSWTSHTVTWISKVQATSPKVTSQWLMATEVVMGHLATVWTTHEWGWDHLYLFYQADAHTMIPSSGLQVVTGGCVLSYTPAKREGEMVSRDYATMVTSLV